LIDAGFIMGDGKIVTKRSIQELLKITESEFHLVIN